MLRHRRALPIWSREVSQSSKFMPSGYDDLDESVHEDEQESRRVFLIGGGRSAGDRAWQACRSGSHAEHKVCAV